MDCSRTYVWRNRRRGSVTFKLQLMWIKHPSGKIAIFVKDPVIVQDNNEVSENNPKEKAKKKK